MIQQLAALILLSTMSVIESTDGPQPISLTKVEVGGIVKLQCPFSHKEDKFFTWYKQSLGYMVQTVATGTYIKHSLRETFNNSRFTLTEGESQYILQIRNVIKEDEATYFCQTGTAYTQTIVNGIFLAVTDPNQQKPVYVNKNPKTQSVQLGDSVTLQCSLHCKNKENRDQCSGEHSVYWFRAGSAGSHPSIIYPHKSRKDEQQESSCVYSLSKTIQNSSDAGTYYCAVVTCGEILFGEGTQVETRSELGPPVIALGVLLACCVAVIALLIFCVSRRRVCEHCQGRFTECIFIFYINVKNENQRVVDGDAETMNYIALDFSKRRVKKGKRKIEPPQECVYSAVRTNHHT
ncbi:Ig kappa chain V-V region HP 91A3 [Channa argus]|uniref:Ig kappa chain V-V region HP 91A3 n=1 Tax=Channa argus TaxID=215402 RepID=A0A6G1PVY3_CHAAH|nr:Ig kappa chain V-V region HP 91A3 [Channa argus]